jgi:hypothetical protein
VRDPQRMLDCVTLMVDGARAWRSPYEGAMHREVADKVVKYLVGNTG